MERFENVMISVSVKTIRMQDNDKKTIENDKKTHSCGRGLKGLILTWKKTNSSVDENIL